MRAAAAAVVVAGLLLFAPALGGHFFSDDYPLILEAEAKGPFALFAHLFRPLSSAAFWLDTRLFGREPFGYHLMSFVLWGCLLVAVVRFFRQLDARWPVVLLATAFFALDDAHVMNVFWPSARHGLFAVTLMMLALADYDVWRRGGSKWALGRALSCVTLALLFSEFAVGTLFWIASYELFLAERRSLKAAPFVALVLVYLVINRASGHGTLAPYVDPLTAPGAYLVAAFERFPQLVTMELTQVRLQLSPIFLWGLCVALLLLLLAPLRHDKLARFMAAGTLSSLLPELAGPVAQRSLLLFSVGTAWLLAAYVVSSRHPVRLVGAVAIVLVHGALAPLNASDEVRRRQRQSQAVWRGVIEAPLPQDEVVLLNGEYRWQSVMFPTIREVARLPSPRTLPVSDVPGDHALRRTSVHAFALEDGREIDLQRPLEEVWLLHWNGASYVRVVPPAVGESMELRMTVR